MAFFLGIAMNYAVGFFVNVLPVPESWVEANQESVNGLYDHGGPVEVFLAIYVLVPLVEEMIFRGKGFKAMESNLGVVAATLISALAFAVAHGNILQGAYAFVAALVFAFIIARSGSLATAVFAHAGFNISGPFIEAFCKNIDDIYLIIGSFLVSAIALGGIVAAGGLADGEKTEDSAEDDEFSEYESLD
jgi:membrane protease YdiL (CAAX protease family)